MFLACVATSGDTTAIGPAAHHHRDTVLCAGLVETCPAALAEPVAALLTGLGAPGPDGTGLRDALDACLAKPVARAAARGDDKTLAAFLAAGLRPGQIAALRPHHALPGVQRIVALANSAHGRLAMRREPGTLVEILQQPPSAAFGAHRASAPHW